MIEFGFLEYSYDSESVSIAEIQNSLHGLGYHCIREHLHEPVSFWVHDLSLLVIREVPNGTTGISGIGVFTDDIAAYGAPSSQFTEPDYDEVLGLQCSRDAHGIRILICTDKAAFNAFVTDNYKAMHDAAGSLNLFERTSGIVYSGADDETVQSYLEIGFREKKRYATCRVLTDTNNKFSMVFLPHGSTGVDSMITESRDAFGTIRALVTNGVEPKAYPKTAPDPNFGHLAHKIVGYNCVATGDLNKYSIESSVPDALPKTNLIFRMRKQMLPFSENLLLLHRAE